MIFLKRASIDSAGGDCLKRGIYTKMNRLMTAKSGHGFNCTGKEGSNKLNFTHLKMYHVILGKI